MQATSWALITGSIIFVLGCGSLEEAQDGRDDTFLGGDKDDAHRIEDGSPEAIGVLAVANTASIEALLDDPPDGAGLIDRAVDNLIYVRLGDDGVPGTADDHVLGTLAELDAVPFIGPIAFATLLAYVRSHGYVQSPGTGPRLGVGIDFACKRTADGAICWGANDAGQLGNGTTTSSLVPTPVAGLPGRLVELSVGRHHACARVDDTARIARSSLLCWGSNNKGQLGDGTLVARSLPTPVQGLPPDVIQIVAGSTDSCALTASGDVYCWGGYAIETGDLPDPTPTPERIALSSIVEIGGNGGTVCARDTAGKVTCWGDDFGEAELVLVPVQGLESDTTAVTFGNSHGCAIRNDTLLCWGTNIYGELGDGTSVAHRMAKPVLGLPAAVTQFSTGYAHTCARTIAGAALCWGQNQFGTLGDGTTTHRKLPTQVAGLATGIIEVAAGYRSSCALRADDTTLCWGDGSHGELGNGTTSTSLVPVLVHE